MSNLTWSVSAGAEEASGQGKDGEVGDTGVGLNFIWSGTQLGVKRENETDYQYVELKGATGSQGIQGDNGPQGLQGIPGVSGLNGVDGKNLEFIWSGTQLGVRQQGQVSYTYVELKGATGLQGPKGADGTQIITSPTRPGGQVNGRVWIQTL